MSSAGQGFSQQQVLANKKHKELTDNDKIYLLKREIDNLRGQLNDKEHDPYAWKNVEGTSPLSSSGNSVEYIAKSSSSSNAGTGRLCASGACFRIPLLSVALIATVLWVASRLVRTSKRRSSPILVSNNAEGFQFEMQEQAPATSEAAESYEAPDASEVRFV
mmetsp:Transcript_6273/g.11541  ORF Transcript_6273/g.11541 Transcript_6273/m.11541 type:complete len:162 (-) Transcript_6273:126-611(-)|eukprot:CAMPEP_0178754216 /NCGR_PEP_ID=MMETSP0744-20121128/12041_1 /TAXON_ID=913974 /ORGANISM="Nitzschia punctata, Strain CCMP561" /LENGTH=161 /DNA_ID=CAMNT_0020408113 /DNA_START=309 /DNA_END=794 /DNA_ORIENTATION=+